MSQPMPGEGAAESGNAEVERRDDVRIPCRLGVRFGSAAELADAVHATTRNIGAGGLCLRTRRRYERGTRLQIVIELRDGRTLALAAEVAWSRPGQAIGVRFEALGDAQREELSKLLRQAAAEAADGLEAAADAATFVCD